MQKPKTPKAAAVPSPTGAKPDSKAPPPPPLPPPLFRKVDWLNFGLTTLLVFIGYFLTLAPNLTLEDCGELAVGSFYAGVPHPPGYPVWTLYSWLFTRLVPFYNVAWRVALSSAVAGALSCGLLSLLVSRGSSMLLEGITEFKSIDRRVEGWICGVAGFVSGMLFGFNGFMWSQSVIVEVYPFSALSFMGVLCCLLRWIYAPQQRRYVYWALFLFGLCMTNHQTLIVASMGIEVAILAAHPRLGRDLFLANSIVYLAGLILKALGAVTTFDNNLPLFVIFNSVGVGSLIVAGWFTVPRQASSARNGFGGYFGGMLLLFLLWMLSTKSGNANLSNSVQNFFILYTAFGIAALIIYSWMSGQKEGLGSEWKSTVLMGLLWVLGALFYFYMPIASMTNPPMNWGYPRTVEGFWHALTRGQYDKTNPTTDAFIFVRQLMMYFEGARDEFGVVALLIGLLPFWFFPRMQKRERAWIVGLAAIYLCLAVLLLILLNPQTDRQSRDQVRVFFTFSHIIIAIAIGYGVTLIGGMLTTEYDRARQALMWGGAIGAGIELYFLLTTFANSKFTLLRVSAVLGLVLALVFTLAMVVSRRRGLIWLALVIFAIIPARSVLSNWSDNEQRGHLFGFWFGHDMFTPPFGIYPEMTRDAVLFGGTDPGRFCPTYMIFDESFIPPSKKVDPNFNRRDVYIITQNALADGTYLEYIRAHYNRSTQIDPPFFQEFFHTKLFAPLDRLFMGIGARIEAARRARGVYPPKEIYTPSGRDSSQSFEDYLKDAQQRMEHDVQFPNEPKQLKPGEEVHPFVDPAGAQRVQVSGQVAVMAINGLLTKVIFEHNPDHEFFVEESFPLDWMYPYETPFGIIMKINRQEVPEFTEEIIRKDHEFWTRYSERLIGNWITYDTSVKEICEFAERTFLHRDYTGFRGDRKFVRDDVAQKSFSKLRSAIGGLYTWRLANSPRYAKTPVEQQRLLKEADFALRQSFAFCPYSPEAVYKYVSLLATDRRFDDALLVVETSLKFDPDNANLKNLAEQIRYMKQIQPPAGPPATGAPSPAAASAESADNFNPNNLQASLPALASLVEALRTNEAQRLMDKILASSAADAGVLLPLAQLAARLNDGGRVTRIVQRLQGQLAALERQYQLEPTNIPLVFQLVSIYLIEQKTNAAEQLLDKVMANPNADANTILSAAQAYLSMQRPDKLESTLQRLVAKAPGNPEAWYDLAASQVVQGKTNEALVSLSRSIELSDQRLRTRPGTNDLRAVAAAEPRFGPLHNNPQFQKLTSKK